MHLANNSYYKLLGFFFLSNLTFLCLVIHFGISGLTEKVGTMRRRAFLKISDSVVSRWSLHVKFYTLNDADVAILENVKTGDEKNVLKEWVGLWRAGGL